MHVWNLEIRREYYPRFHSTAHRPAPDSASYTQPPCASSASHRGAWEASRSRGLWTCTVRQRNDRSTPSAGPAAVSTWVCCPSPPPHSVLIPESSSRLSKNVRHQRLSLRIISETFFWVATCKRFVPPCPNPGCTDFSVNSLILRSS